MIGAVLVLLGALITVVVNVVFIPRYGYVASAWGHLLCYSVMVVLSYMWSRKHYPIPYKTGRILLYVLLALVLFYANELFLREAVNLSDLVGLVLLCFFGVVVFFGERHTFLKYKNG